VNLQAAVYSSGIVDKAHFPEPVHEKAHPGACGTHHLGQGLLTDLRNHGLGHSFLAKMREHQKDAGQSLFAGIEQLVDQILFITDIAGELIRHEHIGQGMFVVQGVHHRLLVDPQNLAVCHCGRRSHAESMACQRLPNDSGGVARVSLNG
jgi:hypothetical protein